MNPPIDLGPFAFGVLGLDPYDWQLDAYRKINDAPRTSIVAANGSGKTAAVIAPAILWWLSCFPKGRVVLTSGSWMQVLLQLMPAMLRHRENPAFRGFVWNESQIKTPAGGWASGFSTDNPGRAEGYHSTHDSPLLYVLDEAKTIPDGIKTAADRCTTDRMIAASSPGAPVGWFYRTHHEEAHLWQRVKVKSTMCPHIHPDKRRLALETYGADHPVFLSMHEAEFSEDLDRLVIGATQLQHAIDNPPEPIDGEVVAFCDFAAGGDENTLAIRRGNTVRLVAAWTDKDTVQAVRKFARLFSEHELTASCIWGDASGLGITMINELEELGWRINKFYGGSPGTQKTQYENAIAEAWIEGACDITHGRVRVENMDAITHTQMTARRLEWSSTGRLRLEAKEKMRKSPDRADAIFGAIYCGARLSNAMTPQSAVMTQQSPFHFSASGFNVI